jgi:predicted peptidase
MNRDRLFGLAAATLIAASPAHAQEAAQPGYGTDPVTADPALPQTPGAVGDQQRHYYFEEAGVETPYRIYVPTDYDPTVPTPLVVALHGYSGTQNYFFQLSDDLPGQLEAHGFIFVAPMGFNRGSWYGNGGPATRGGDPQNTSEIIVKNGLSVTELGEMDVMNVLDIVRGEYNVDPSRTYLMGHSMGGAGTYYLGSKHGHIWAALAPIAPAAMGMTNDRTEVLQAIKAAGVPMLVSMGDADEAVPVANVRTWVETMEELQMNYEYKEYPGVTHGPIMSESMADIYAFFAKHAKPAGN